MGGERLVTDRCEDPAEITERLIRFVSHEVNRTGVRARLILVLKTDYKRLNRFCALPDGERPVRDITFMLALLTALNYNTAEVFEAAAICVSADEMRLRLRRGQRPHSGLSGAA